VKIIVACIALYNFITKHIVNDIDFQPYDNGDVLLPIERIGDDEA
jgi:hypothetical protein